MLLCRRADEPYKGEWVLPSGYVDYEESCEEAAAREALEELSTKVELQGLHGVYSFSDDPRSRMVVVVYRANCNPTKIRAADDVKECHFFHPQDLPKKIAFEGIRRAIEDWRKKL